MAIGWTALIQAVPWSQVIENAPKVVEGAKKLWSAATGNPGPRAPAAEVSVKGLSPEAQAMASLERKVAALEASAAEFHSQMQASSELTKSLAEQNAQLIRRIEANRLHVLLLSAIAGVALLVAIAALSMALTGNGA